MDVRQQPCNLDNIERFLADRLSAEELNAFEDHLGSCFACRRELEARAADESWWSAARDCLTPISSTSSRLASPAAAPNVVEGTEPWPQPDEGSSLLAAIKPFLNPTDDPRMLGRIGSYEIAGVVGSGGNGVVLKGFDAALSRYVAIKLLSPRLADSGAARRRFSREAQAAAAIVHDNVMAIHAVAETHGLPYLVMPYVRGPSLESRLRTSGPLALEEVLRVGRQVAAGLAAAHAQGLVHRDIKPANILLEEGVERVRITDFGLARAMDDASLTRSGVIAGTPQYMSPEQARGEPLDHRADLFSLGCVLYTACAGRSPFRAETSYGVLRKICESEPRDLRELNAGIPPWLVRLIDRLLAKSPSQRFDTATEVATLFEQCLAHVQQPATIALPAALREHGKRATFSHNVAMGWIARHRLAASVIVLLVGGGIGAWAWQSAPLRKESARQAEVAKPSRRHGSPAAPAAQNDGAPDWNDQVDKSIARLSDDVKRLRGESADDLWNDPLSGRLERLKGDVNDLTLRTSDADTSTPLQENQP
jgi:hypothetical protein